MPLETAVLVRLMRCVSQVGRSARRLRSQVAAVVSQGEAFREDGVGAKGRAIEVLHGFGRIYCEVCEAACSDGERARVGSRAGARDALGGCSGGQLLQD